MSQLDNNEKFNIPKFMSFGFKRYHLIGIVIVFTITLAKSLLTPIAAEHFRVEAHQLPTQEVLGLINNLHTRVISTDDTRLVHASSVVQLQSGGLMATWWGGLDEGTKDVQIYTAFFNPDSQSWGEPLAVQSAKKTQAQTYRYIRKLGNPIIFQDHTGKLHLIYVSVSIGGWSTSALNWMSSADEGATWSASRRLITAPVLNLSTLAKGAPIFFTDGSFGLPVYHELAGKFGELLKVSLDGNILSKTRLSKGREALQPVIHALNAMDARVLMRHAGDGEKKVLQTTTFDGGVQWNTPFSINIANPNSAVALAAHPHLGEIGVFNDLVSGRDRLNLYRYGIDNQWVSMFTFEDKTSLKEQSVSPKVFEKILTNDVEHYLVTSLRKKQIIKQAIKTMCKDAECEFQYDYPYLIQGKGNQYHLVYTWNKSSIMHVTFTLLTVDKSL